MTKDKRKLKIWRGPHEAHSMGGKTSSANMTRDERVARGKKARAQRSTNEHTRNLAKLAQLIDASKDEKKVA